MHSQILYSKASFRYGVLLRDTRARIPRQCMALALRRVPCIFLNIYYIQVTEKPFTSVSSGQTLYQAVSWRLILQSSLLQRFTVESSRELSALRKLNNKQRQVSMFLILLLKLLTQFPFVSFLYPLSAPFLNPLPSLTPIPSFSSDHFFVFLR